jgi:hypothetical protein
VEPNTADPLALIIAGGAAAISGLAGLVLTMVASRMKAIQRGVETLERDIAGQSGLFVRVTAVEGRLTAAETNIQSLRADTLTKQVFDQSIEAQNRTLEEMKDEGQTLDRKVDRINLQLASRPWSQQGMAAVRPPPRAEPESDSDRPDPPRPRTPSRPK